VDTVCVLSVSGTCRSKIDVLNIHVWFTLKMHFVGHMFIIISSVLVPVYHTARYHTFSSFCEIEITVGVCWQILKKMSVTQVVTVWNALG
jgi:hypothetical protein